MTEGNYGGVTGSPLDWPEGWPRTPRNEQEAGAQFNQLNEAGQRTAVPIDRAFYQLCYELRMLGASNVVTSCNHVLDERGFRAASTRRVGDEGVAIYFMHRGKALVMACDRFDNAAANMRSLGLAIAAMRQLDRHGGGNMTERAFSGFLAIAPPNWKKPWHQVFGVKEDWRGDIRELYRAKARERHPDAGGSDTLMAELNVAFAEAKLALGQPSQAAPNIQVSRGD